MPAQEEKVQCPKHLDQAMPCRRCHFEDLADRVERTPDWMQMPGQKANELRGIAKQLRDFAQYIRAI